MTGVDIASLHGCAVGIFGRDDGCNGAAARVSVPVDREFRGSDVVIHSVRCDSCGAYGFLVVQDDAIRHRVGSFFGESEEATAVLEDIYEDLGRSIIDVARYLAVNEGAARRMLERYNVHEPQIQASKILEEADPDDWPKGSGTQLVTDGGDRDGR